MSQTEVKDAPIKSKQEFKTCKITLVGPSSASDRVIKVYPAEHEAEKVWLENTPGIERWRAIERLLMQFAPRGEAVPKPVAYCSGNDLKTVVITEDDIPIVRLDGGAFLKAPPPEEKPDNSPKASPRVENLQLRMTIMEKTQEQTLAAINGLTKAVEGLASRQRPEQYQEAAKDPQDEPIRVPCGLCDKNFKTKAAVAMHKGKVHKEAK